MLLADNEIKVLLAEMDFDTDSDTRNFNPSDQIQPASVDLTLSSVVWRARRRFALDMRKSQVFEMHPRHHWRRLDMRKGESITVRPGEMVLGRTSEIFTMPSNLCGRLEGRSSFARLGLMITCTGAYINPGWRGHMPLQLVNLSQNTIRLMPHLPVCQLLLFRLSGTPERLYGERELQSKYMDDDGGPSYWWRDTRVKELQKRLREVDLSLAMQEEVIRAIGRQEPEVADRFQRHVDKLRVSDMQNIDVLLESFARAEVAKKRRATVFRGALIGQMTMFLGLVGNSLFSSPIKVSHWIAWIGMPISAAVAYMAYRHDIGSFFGERELGEIVETRKKRK